jgi:uncharacterized damage-inducible protein DinB
MSHQNITDMKRTTTLLLTVLAVVAATAFLSFVTVDKSRSTEKVTATLADWERAKAYTKEYLDAASEETFAYKPTAEMRSFGQQMMHIAEANYGIGSAATGKSSPVSFGQLEKSDKAKSKAEVTKAVMESYDFVIAGAKTLTDAQLAEMVKVFNMDMSRETALAKTFEHQTHHRGQTTVYLRLKGITPPGEKLF